MTDLIYREMVISLIETNPECNGCCDIDCAQCIIDGINKNIPSVDAEPVRHGWWDDNHKCTACKLQCVSVTTATGMVMRVETPYCPNCGAKMNLKEGE